VLYTQNGAAARGSFLSEAIEDEQTLAPGQHCMLMINSSYTLGTLDHHVHPRR